MRFTLPILAAAACFANPPQDKLLETGKKIFVERCGSCHDERGDKPLSSGVPLNQRSLSEEQIARAVVGRLKGSPPVEKRAVALYIKSLK